MEQDASISNEEKDRLHKLIVLVGDQGSECYKRDLNKLNDVLSSHLNKNLQNNWTKTFILKKLSARWSFFYPASAP